MSKKILIVTRYFYPENTPRAFRATELANEFAAQGNEVVILTCKNYNIHPDLEEKHSFTIRDFGSVHLKPVNYESSNKLSSIIKTVWRRLLLMLFEYPDIELMWLVKQALKNESGYDLLISNAVPHPIHWGVAWARSKKNRIAKIWAADCGDPYMGCKTDSFKKLFYFSFLEKWFMRKADFITLPNQDHKSQYYSQFHDKIRIIPQGFKFENSSVYNGEIKNSIPTFAFAGVLLKQTRNPQNILDYLATVDVDFKFIIYTQSIELVEKYIPILKHKIEIRPFVVRNELLYVLSQMDFLLNIEFHASVRSNSPSKLIDYYIVNRPVLSLNMEYPDYEKINKFLRGDYTDRLIVHDVDKFRIENVTMNFLNLVEINGL